MSGRHLIRTSLGTLSFMDFVFPLASIAVTYVFRDVGFLAGAVIASLYGYFCAEDSNARQREPARPAC